MKNSVQSRWWIHPDSGTNPFSSNKFQRCIAIGAPHPKKLMEEMIFHLICCHRTVRSILNFLAFIDAVLHSRCGGPCSLGNRHALMKTVVRWCVVVVLACIFILCGDLSTLHTHAVNTESTCSGVLLHYNVAHQIYCYMMYGIVWYHTNIILYHTII